MVRALRPEGLSAPPAGARGVEMITAEQVALILRMHHAEKWRPNTIARQLRLHHSTVQRVLERAGLGVLARISFRRKTSVRSPDHTW